MFAGSGIGRFISLYTLVSRNPYYTSIWKRKASLFRDVQCISQSLRNYVAHLKAFSGGNNVWCRTMKAYTQSYVMREHPMAGAVALHWSRLEAAVSVVSLSAGFNLQEGSVNLRRLNAAVFTCAKKRKVCDCDRVYKHLTLSWGKKKKLARRTLGAKHSKVAIGGWPPHLKIFVSIF